jgi:hypothetical protein
LKAGVALEQNETKGIGDGYEAIASSAITKAHVQDNVKGIVLIWDLIPDKRLVRPASIMDPWCAASSIAISASA